MKFFESLNSFEWLMVSAIWVIAVYALVMKFFESLNSFEWLMVSAIWVIAVDAIHYTWRPMLRLLLSSMKSIFRLFIAPKPSKPFKVIHLDIDDTLSGDSYTKSNNNYKK